MSWKKYFKVADTPGGQMSPINGQNQFGLPGYGKQTGYGTTSGPGNDFSYRNYAKIGRAHV